jgi:phosphoenolpyruvate-protein kinase (PTS system EI component)
VTELGYTPAVASSVVTGIRWKDVAPLIVACEFGIPGVAHTLNATTRPRYDQGILVDGTTGTVEVVAD